MLSLKFHNVADYATGLLLLFTPLLFGFSHIDAARNFFLFAGMALISYSLLTRYYYAAVRWIPLGPHMALDAALGLLVVLAPWLLSYRELLLGGQEWAHYGIGLALMSLVALTRTKTETDRRYDEPLYPNRYSSGSRV